MLANNQMRIIGPPALNFSRKETAAILEQTAHAPLDSHTISLLHQRTRGWAAGLILLATHIQKENMPPKHIATRTPAEVYDYFAGELFDIMDDPLKDFLLKTSLLPVMTASTAKSLTDQDNAGRMLSALHRDHVFVERFSGSAFTYQYHPLFRDFLVSRAQNVLHPQTIYETRQRAASLMESSGRIEDAAELYADIGDTASLIRLIHSNAIRVITQGRLEILNSWLKWLPQPVLDKDPWLLFWLGMSFRPVSAGKAKRCFENAFYLFEQSQNRFGIYLAWSKIIDSIILAWDDFTHLDPWIDWLDAHPLDEQPDISIEIKAKVASCMSGALIIRKPHHPQLALWIEAALDLSRETTDLTTQLKASIWTVTHCMWVGDFARAELIKEKARKFIQLNSPSPLTRQFWRWLEISAEVRTMGSPESVLKDILHILKKADQRGEHLMDQMFFPPGMFAALVLADFSKAKTLLTRFGTIPDDTHRHGHAIFHHFKGLFHMIQGQDDQAFAHAETALKMVRQTGYLFYEALYRFQMAHLLQKMARYPEAENHLSQAHKLAIQLKSRMLEFMCLLEKARICLNREACRLGMRLLRNAMTLGRENGFMAMIWWWDPVMISELCAEALMAGIEVDYARHMLQRHRLIHRPPINHIEAWPWTVKVYTLGRFQILIDGKPLRFKGRYPKKPLELLQALIAFNGDDVPVDRILDALWYDADGDLAHSAFSTTLNRLRMLLGTKEIIQLKNSMVSINMNYCWVDSLAFQHLLNKGDVHRRRHQRKESVMCYEKASVCYKGLFLPGEIASPWIIATRERLKNNYLSLIKNLGGLLERAGETEKAMAYYKAGLGIDDLVESLYQRLMTCQLRLGRHADVVRTYQRCHNRLSAALNVNPSAETKAIYEKLGN
jgi:DNA-binding SARP family transcriptional activator